MVTLELVGKKYFNHTKTVIWPATWYFFLLYIFDWIYI